MSDVQFWTTVALGITAPIALFGVIAFFMQNQQFNEVVNMLRELEEDVEWLEESYHEMHTFYIERETEIDTIRDINLGLAERVAVQSDQLSALAEKQPSTSEEALERCKKWELTQDEEVRELLQ